MDTLPQSKKTRSFYEVTIEVLLHEVACWWEIDPDELSEQDKDQLQHDAEERVEFSIKSGCGSGELSTCLYDACKPIGEANERFVRGWYEIV